MMLHVLAMIYSAPFYWGALVGTVVWKLYCHSKARLEDRHHPLPSGKKHAVARMSRVWVAGLCAVWCLGYVLLSTGRTEEHTVELNAAVNRCWSETYQQMKAQVEINTQNENITRQHQQLQRDYDEYTASWLKQLVNPPGDMAGQPTNSPERQDWGLKITAQYQAQLDDLGRQFDALVEQRRALDAERARHPLPEERCGRSMEG
jgi:hypothetical protein